MSPPERAQGESKPEVLRVGVLPAQYGGWSWSVTRLTPAPQVLLGAGVAPNRESAWADCASVVNDMGEDFDA